MTIRNQARYTQAMEVAVAVAVAVAVDFDVLFRFDVAKCDGHHSEKEGKLV